MFCKHGYYYLVGSAASSSRYRGNGAQSSPGFAHGNMNRQPVCFKRLWLIIVAWIDVGRTYARAMFCVQLVMLATRHLD